MRPTRSDILGALGIMVGWLVVTAFLVVFFVIFDEYIMSPILQSLGLP